MTSLTATLRPTLNLHQSLKAIFRSVAEDWTRHRIYAQTKRELEALSERDLEDIGLARWNIEDLAHETAYGRKK